MKLAFQSRMVLFSILPALFWTPAYGAEDPPQTWRTLATGYPPMEGRPAVMPTDSAYPEFISQSPEMRAMTTYDQRTGQLSTGAARYPAPWLFKSNTKPRQPLPIWDADRKRFIDPLIALQAGSEPGSSLDGTLSCTAPVPNLATHATPLNSVVKIRSRYRVDGVDHFSNCSAAVVSDFHLLTAGHCIYSFDPDDDITTTGAAFADEVWVHAAQTDYISPHMGEGEFPQDTPYSFAKSTRLRVPNGWILAADVNHDVGWITLDRRLGNRTGWMGREFGIEATTLNFSGYPTQIPHVPAKEIRQYPGFDSGNVDAYSEFRISMCAFIYGGHSGGPVWRFDSVNHWIQGVNSTSNRLGGAFAARLDAQKFADLVADIAQDEVESPPENRTDLAEYFFSTTDEYKDLLLNSVPQDELFTVEYNVFNAGFSSSGEIEVDFVLSTNKDISYGDFYIGTQVLAPLEGYSFTNPTTHLVARAPPGEYFLGWIMHSENPEYDKDWNCSGVPCSNRAVIGGEKLTITESIDCSEDGFEPDDSQESARIHVANGLTQNHSICPVGDEDWVKFTVEQTSSAIIRTSGFGGDTFMRLNDSQGNLIVVDDDSGNDNFSQIVRSCNEEALVPGTYFVRVSNLAAPVPINSYGLSIDTWVCQIIMSDGFEGQ